MLLLPLGVMLLLAGGDYELWSWSLASDHDVLALVCGLTLAPLSITLLWLALLCAARVLKRAAAEPRREPWRSAMSARSQRRAGATAAAAEPRPEGEPASMGGPSSSGSIAA